jgi:hypothetical protein
MRKTIAMFLALTLMTVLFAGCTPAHTHTGGQWDRDAGQHWKLCDCGEKLDAGSHEMDDEGICAICGSQIWDHGDNVIEYRAWEFLYDQEGYLEWECEYDAQGKVNEVHYARATDDDGSDWSYVHFYTEYFPDGSKTVTENNEYEEPIQITIYDAAGKIVE